MERFLLQTLDPERLAEERKRVHALLSACNLPGQTFEVGSTAVPGVLGKQDLDFLVRVPAADFHSARERLDQHFERNAGQLSNDQYQAYHIPSTLDVAIQLTIEGGPYDTFSDFLSCLATNPEIRAAYNTLKLAYNGKPMNEYRAAKSQFIEATLATFSAPPAPETDRKTATWAGAGGQNVHTDHAAVGPIGRARAR